MDERMCLIFVGHGHIGNALNPKMIRMKNIIYFGLRKRKFNADIMGQTNTIINYSIRNFFMTCFHENDKIDLNIKNILSVINIHYHVYLV